MNMSFWNILENCQGSYGFLNTLVPKGTSIRAITWVAAGTTEDRDPGARFPRGNRYRVLRGSTGHWALGTQMTS